MIAITQAKAAENDGLESSVAMTPSTARHRQLAFIVVIATLLAYAAILSHAAVQLPRVDSFIPTMSAIIFVADLVAAVLLFAQFATTGSRPVLMLASGYLFSSLIIIGYVLTFPGAFAPTGLLWAGTQSATWLNFLWRFGFAASIAGYAVLRSGKQMNALGEFAPRSRVSWSVATVLIVVIALICAVTAGHDLLPLVILDGQISSLGRYVNGGIAAIDLLALLLLLVLTRGRSILDLWLIVVAVALLAESMMMTFLVLTRFSLAFYAIRLIAPFVSKIVLMALLWETMRLHANLSFANRELRRERANRLTSAEAVVASISHEIKQPLTNINLLAFAGQRLLDQESPDVSAAKKHFGEIEEDAFRVNQIFDGFLKFFRGGKQDWQAVDVNALALEATRLLGRDLDDHGVTTSTQLASGLPLVLGHAGQLREVVLNLIQNSIDAMTATTNRPRVISIATSRLGAGAIFISLQDTGPGIEPGQLARMFDPFVTTKAKGTGLGLAICKMIIEQHGGELSAASNKNGGARFEITLPTRAGRSAGAASPCTEGERLQAIR